MHTFTDLQKELFAHVFNVYEIFQHYFGEEYVDIQNIPKFQNTTLDIESLKHVYAEHIVNIIVWWPEVTVTNEHNKSVNIQDLYAKIPINIEGKIPYECKGFKLLRTSFSEVQWGSNYQHSHIKARYNMPEWEVPCLGTGPIKNTIATLHNNNDDTFWFLFCEELNRYVQVESLAGTPYMKLEDIGNPRHEIYEPGYNLYFINYYNAFEKYINIDNLEILKDFPYWYIQNNNLILNYTNNHYVIGMPYFKFILDISNSFIEWFNIYGNEEAKQSLFRNNIIDYYIIKNNKFYSDVRSYNNITVPSCELLIFKNQSIKLKVFKSDEETITPTLILNNNLAISILHKILSLINYYANNSKNARETELTPINQKNFYV